MLYTEIIGSITLFVIMTERVSKQNGGRIMEKVFEDGVVIRPFRMEDEGIVREFFSQLGPETRALFDRNNYNSNVALSWFGLERKEHFSYFLAEKDGLMVGYVYIWEDDTTIPNIGVCVREEWKGKHLGRRLIAFVEEYTRALGCGGMILTTGFGNVRGWGLYSRMGFEYMGSATDGEALFLKKYKLQ